MAGNHVFLTWEDQDIQWGIQRRTYFKPNATGIKKFWNDSSSNGCHWKPRYPMGKIAATIMCEELNLIDKPSK